MGKPFRCKLGMHEWKLKGKGNDMNCKFCGKEYDNDEPVGDFNKRKWYQSGEGGESGGG